MGSELELEIRKLRDMQEIQQVLNMYSVAIDSREPENMIPLFTPDAVIQVGELEVMSVEKYALDQKPFLHKMEATQHAISTAVIEVNGDTANSRSYFVAQHTRNKLGDNCMLLIGGHYDDEFVRIDGQWYIKKRIGTSAWMDGNTEVLGWQGNIGGQAWVDQRSYPQWLKARLEKRQG